MIHSPVTKEQVEDRIRNSILLRIFMLHWIPICYPIKRCSMAIVLPRDLEEQLRRIAEREQRSPEEVLRTLLIGYSTEPTEDADYCLDAIVQRLYNDVICAQDPPEIKQLWLGKTTRSR